MGVIVSMLSGVLMSVQGVFNTGLTKQAGLWCTAAFVQFSAFVVCIIAWFATGREGGISELMYSKDKYMLLGGVIGAFITITVVKGMGQLGPAKAVMIIVISQLISAYIIELFGWFGAERAVFEWRKIIGMAAAMAGVIIFKWE